MTHAQSKLISSLKDDEDAEELEDAFFENQLDPMSLLESMGKQEAGSQAPAAAQPYQILTKTARQARVQTVKPRRRTRQREDPSSTDEVSTFLLPARVWYINKPCKCQGSAKPLQLPLWSESHVQMFFATCGRRVSQETQSRFQGNAALASSHQEYYAVVCTFLLSFQSVHSNVGECTREGGGVLKRVGKGHTSLLDTMILLSLAATAVCQLTMPFYDHSSTFRRNPRKSGKELKGGGPPNLEPPLMIFGKS